MPSSRLDRCQNISDLRKLARRRLPRGVFDFADGGAEDEKTRAGNRAAYGRHDLLPRPLVDVGDVDLATTVLGQRVELPLLAGSCGFLRLYHHDAEIGAARAAHNAGTAFMLATMTSISVEDVAAASDGPLWFQVYVPRDRGLLAESLQRAHAAGCHAAVLTVDTPVMGRNERLLGGRTDPPGLSPLTALDGLLHARWLSSVARPPKPEMPHFLPGSQLDLARISSLTAENLDPTVTWSDLEWMLERWDGPFVLKGVVRPEDAVRAVDLGVDAVIVSNHGGRQLDQAPPTLDVLPSIVEAVGDRAEVLIDGGVRRGSDIVKALALGARACLVGRAYVYGLAAGGEAGVSRAFELLRNELERTLALIGCTSVQDLDPSYLRAATSP